MDDHRSWFPVCMQGWCQHALICFKMSPGWSLPRRCAVLHSVAQCCTVLPDVGVVGCICTALQVVHAITEPSIAGASCGGGLGPQYQGDPWHLQTHGRNWWTLNGTERHRWRWRMDKNGNEMRWIMLEVDLHWSLHMLTLTLTHFFCSETWWGGVGAICMALVWHWNIFKPLKSLFPMRCPGPKRRVAAQQLVIKPRLTKWFTRGRSKIQGFSWLQSIESSVSEWLHVNVIVFHGIPYYSKVIIPYGSCIFPHRSQDFPVFGYLSIFLLFLQPSSNLISGLARLFLADIHDIRRLQGQWLSPSRPTRRQRQRVRHLAAALLRRWCHRRYSSPGSQSKRSETHRQRSQLVVAS